VIEVIAPGFKSTEEEFSKAVQYLSHKGYAVQFGSDLWQKKAGHFLCSSDDESRFEDIVKALYSEDSRVIWCLRGGYGAIRLLPYLKTLKKPRHKKLLIGISDVTSLHNFLNEEWGWPTLHSSLLDRLGMGKVPAKIEKEIWNLLEGQASEVEFKNLVPLNPAAFASAKNGKVIEAPVVGGNLTVLQSLLATPFHPDFSGKILAIEDLGERGYRVDRIFEQFEQAGIFDGIKALVIGEFLGGEEPLTKKQLWKQVFVERALRYGFPVFKGLQMGHGVIQRPVPFLTKAQLTLATDKTKASLVIEMVKREKN
jgi:muramoyltetrapeptide carboxypeptidase